MKVDSFHIKNFKGINEATLSLSSSQGSIYTLVGLNESGKTTILEAINFFNADTDGIHAIAQKPSSVTADTSLVPKKLKDNFNGVISVSAKFSFDSDDHAELASRYNAKHEKQELIIDKIPQNITVEKQSVFKNSAFIERNNFWTGFYPSIKEIDENGLEVITQLKAGSDEWAFLVKAARELMPRIVFFPTFLFEFPEKIQISGIGSESESNSYFKYAIKDALASLEPALDLDDHVVNRITSKESSNPFATFITSWFASDEKEQVDTVLSKLSAKLTEEIFGRWKEVLGSDIGDKTIEIRSSIEAGKGLERNVFLTFVVKDGFSSFKVSERSLGFRWFFCFLFFTKFFRLHDGGKAIFLFDEPASNLHSLAQSKLLDSLKDIADNKNDIIYSTHSHYLINPLWLETAFIVTNGSILEDEAVVDSSFGVEDVDITVKKYKTFVGENAEQGHYFQPILDKLRIQPSLLQAVNGAVLVEGKSDFYILNWFKKYHSSDLPIHFVPVGSASKADSLISLYLGLGKDFVFLFDNDGKNGAGPKERERYLRLLPVTEKHFINMAEPFSFDVKAIESLLSSKTKKDIRDHYGVAKASKKLVLRAFSEALSGKNIIPADASTISNLSILTAHLKSRLNL